MARKMIALTAAAALLLPAAVMLPAAAASVTYTFENCAEGWKVRTNLPDHANPNHAWHRQPPGDGSTQAFYAGPPYAGDGASEALISPAHAWKGGRITMRFSIVYQFEPEETSLGADNIQVEWSRNARDWLPLAKYKPISEGFPQFKQERVSFRAPKGRVYVRFRLNSDALVEGFGAAIDNVVLPMKKPSSARC